jgi:phosphatidylglycerophosphatase A
MNGVNPLILFGIIGLIIVLLTYKFLDETKDKPLQDFIEENDENEKPIIEMNEL